MSYYKILRDGRSCHGGQQEWPLPTQREDGTWDAGEWVSFDGPLRMCVHGLHLTSDPFRWWVDGSTLYRAEYSDEAVGPDGDKLCVRRARLLAPADWSEGCVYSEGQHSVADRSARAYGSATVRAYGSTTVEAYDSTTVEASGSATVEAYDSATVRAYGSATVEASGSATVRASDSATVRAYGSATVEASGSATVEAYGSATVEAYGSATVRAYDSATVRASDSATVISSPYHAADAVVTLRDHAVHVDRRGAGVVLRCGVEVQP